MWDFQEGLESFISDAHDVVRILKGTFDSLPLEGATRELSFAYGLLRIAQKHHQGILGLLDAENFASASALMRPCVETTARAVWVASHPCSFKLDSSLAKEEMVGLPFFKQMAEEITLVLANNSEPTIEPVLWKRTCDYVHGGPTAIKLYMLGLGNSDRLVVEQMRLVSTSTAHVLLGSLAFLIHSKQDFARAIISDIARQYLYQKSSVIEWWQYMADNPYDDWLYDSGLFEYGEDCPSDDFNPNDDNN